MERCYCYTGLLVLTLAAACGRAPRGTPAKLPIESSVPQDAGQGDEKDEDKDGTEDPSAVCGDLVVDPGEGCDDGVTTDCEGTQDGGDGTCVPAGTCSPGYVTDGSGCVLDTCGDGLVDADESCDDGVTTDCEGTQDGGDGTCVPVGTCSPGYVAGGPGCIPDPCGNGLVDAGESCDDGVTTDCVGTQDGGDGTCVPAGTCSPGYVASASGCIPDPCGNGVVDAGESCDDGVTDDCAGTQDGGAGACVPAGTCSPGYTLGAGGCVVDIGLSTPCSFGNGFRLLRFHYDGSTSPSLDTWDASCSYSYAPGSACNVVEVWADSLVHSGSALLVSGSGYIRVRFSVAGLDFTQAAVYVQARSYSTSASTGIEFWSPLYGSAFAGPVDNDWVFDWYGVDWSGFLYPNDDPDLTAVQIYANGGANSLAIHAVEICLE